MHLRRRVGLRVFAQEDDRIQFTWRETPPGELTIRIGDQRRTHETDGGPGALTVDGLEPDRRYLAVVEIPGVAQGGVGIPVRTLRRPWGPELCRIATLSDLHLGAETFSTGRRMAEPRAPGLDRHTVRCARAAVEESLAWGAERLFVKGDITDAGRPEQWDLAGKLFADLPVGLDAIAGNHDLHLSGWSIDPTDGARRAQITVHHEVSAIDLDGIRVVLVPTTKGAHRRGHLSRDRIETAVSLVTESDRPVLALLHHHLERAPIPWFWPPGVGRRRADAFLDALAATDRDVLVSSGHTHRHRRFERRGIVATEVGSPKDYPGTWAGYVVHPSGIRQVVRRVEARDCIVWTEFTRHAAFGAWGRWSEGRRRSRSFVLPWRDQTTVGGAPGATGEPGAGSSGQAGQAGI